MTPSEWRQRLAAIEKAVIARGVGEASMIRVLVYGSPERAKQRALQGLEPDDEPEVLMLRRVVREYEGG
jgi:hypothetical protein